MDCHAAGHADPGIATAPDGTPALLAEMETLKQRLAALEATLPGRSPDRRGRWNVFSRGAARPLTLLTSLAVLAVASLVYGQSAMALFISPEGNVGIGSTAPTQKLDVAGTIRSSSGGFQFPDGTTQTTAAIPAGGVVAFQLPACPAGWSEFAPAYGRFIRGIDKSGQRIDPDGERPLAGTQEDAIRNITGSISGVQGASDRAWPWGFRPGTSGAFSVPVDWTTYNKYAGDYNPPGGSGSTAIFDASKAPGVLTAADNRPKNVALLYCRKN